MSKRTKVLSGEAARKYFRTLFSADLSHDPAVASRLTETCVREIAELRVRMPVVAFRLAGPPETERKPPAETVPAGPADPEPVQTPTLNSSVPALPNLTLPVLTSPVSDTPQATPQPVAIAPTALEAPFDPFAFSLIVTLRRDGADALRAKLQAVGDIAQLRQIAKAQHVGIDHDEQELTTVCEQIVAGTVRRVAHREAAAS